MHRVEVMTSEREVAFFIEFCLLPARGNVITFYWCGARSRLFYVLLKEAL